MMKTTDLIEALRWQREEKVSEDRLCDEPFRSVFATDEREFRCALFPGHDGQCCSAPGDEGRVVRELRWVWVDVSDPESHDSAFEAKLQGLRDRLEGAGYPLDLDPESHDSEETDRG